MTLEYFEIEGAPGRYFRCERYSATLSTDACARMFKNANGHSRSRRDGIDRGVVHDECIGCPIGAEHAGMEPPTAPELFLSLLCPRCNRASSRIVRGLCISCINRQYESIKGKNAKGTAPVNLPALMPMRIAFVSQGRARVAANQHCSSRLELIFRVLRTHQHVAGFAWHGQVCRDAPTEWV